MRYRKKYIKLVTIHLKRGNVKKKKRSEFKVSSLDQLDNNNTALVDKIADNNNQYDTLMSMKKLKM